MSGDGSGAVGLPRGWAFAEVGDVASEVKYGTSSKTNDDSGGVPVIRMGNISNGVLQTSDLKYLPKSHDEFPDLLLADGDLLFNRTNSPELVGKCAVFRGHTEAFSFASYLIRVRLVEISPEYVAHWINSADGRSWIASVVNQQVGQANVNGTKLRALRFPLPPLAEQRRIVAKLDELLARSRATREALTAVLPLLERYRQSVLGAALLGELTEEWRQAQGRSQTAWMAVSLESVALTIRNGISETPTEQGDLPILRINAVRPLRLRTNDLRAVQSRPEYGQYLLRAGDVLVTRYSGSKEFVGVAAVVEECPERLVYPDKLIRIRVREELVLPQWIALCLCAGPTRAFVLSNIKSAAGQIGLAGKDLRKAPIPFPPLPEQQEIVRRVDAAFARIAAVRQLVEAQLARLDALDRSILARAFRGELVPQDPSDEPASALLDRIRAERAAAPAKAARRGRPAAR